MSNDVSPEPPLTISLHGFPQPPNHPSFSGYCQKLETFFRMTSFQHYTLVPSSLGSSPTGKLPYITVHHTSASTVPQNEIIADSHFIIRTLVSRGTIPDPDAALTPEQKVDSRAMCVWVEQHVYPAVVYQQWSRPHNSSYRISTLPIHWLIRPLVGWYIKRNICSALWTAGVGRYSDKEVDEVVTEWLDGLEVKLGDGREWLMGKGVGPGLVDATVWGFLINFVGVGEGNSECLGWIRERKGVCGFVRRGARRWFPEYNVEKMLGTGEGVERVY